MSTSRVLTSEFVPGRRLYDVLDEPQEVRDRLGQTIYRFALESVFSGVFSGDPHPGNYIFMDDGRVCFIDFGFVERVEDPEVETKLAKAPVLAALAGDAPGITASLGALGLLPARGKSDPAKMWDELCPILFGPIQQDVVVRLDSDLVSAAFRQTIKLSSEIGKLRKSTNLRPWIIALLRYSGGTLAVIGKLQAEANWQQLIRELVNDEPAA